MKRIKNNLKTNFAVIVAALLIAVMPQALMARTTNHTVNSSSSTTASGPGAAQLAKQVRHRLLMLPYYGVFDNLAYSIDGGQVTLHGQVVRPSTRSDAGRSVAGIQGVTEVVNNIQVLPLSSFDDSIRVRTYRALARTSGLYRYFMGTNPSLHIVVERGNITLAGVVSGKMDKQLAYMTARGVPGAFSVTNDLQIEGDNEAR
ncbi:MAG: BON domain-containing protein [Acidobacteriota bacterium]|nr:BON domain-containing protein [Acidobacteriota bacterium]